jgi:hypothetical protein
MRASRPAAPPARGPLHALAIAICLQAWSGARLHAQAWIPVQGEGAVSVTYQNYDVAGHYDKFGHKNHNGGTHSQVAVCDVDYGISDAIGVSVALPLIASKYTGPPLYFVGGIETHPGPLDDGRYHAAFQDLRVEIRRLFWAGSIPIAPFAAGVIPTHDYEVVGEAVPGRHRRDFQVGADSGMDLERWLTGAYLHVRYGYARAQKIEGFEFNRSNIDLEIGYAVRSQLTVRGLAAWQIRHQGPEVVDLSVDWDHHDRFIAPGFTNLGLGVSVPMGRADLYAAYVGTARGNNGAHRARTVAAGVTFAFGSSSLSGLGSSSSSLRSGIAPAPSRHRFGRR